MAFPKTHNFDYYRGDTFEFKIYPRLQSGESFELSPYDSIAFKIADKRGSGATQTSASAVSLTDAEGDYVLCTIIPSVGRNLTSGQYVYDVQITDTTPDPDVIYTILTGIITVTDDITGAV